MVKWQKPVLLLSRSLGRQTNTEQPKTWKIVFIFKFSIIKTPLLNLVYRTEEKNVLLTLMDLARLASRFGLAELPELVRMEKEIEALEAAEAEANARANGGTQTVNNNAQLPKVDIGVYAARLADRKASVSSPERPPSSISSDIEGSSIASSVSSGVTSEPVVRYCSNASFTTTDVLLTDFEDDEKSLGVSVKIDSSTLINTTDEGNL